jgi:hypothetical protein
MMVFVSDGFTDLQGSVDEDADLDGEFELIEEDTGERLMVKGWLAVELEIL